MKKYGFFIIFGVLLLASSALHAQDFLQKAKNYLDAGECEKAQRAYNAYKVENPGGNTEVERGIAECLRSNDTTITLNGEIMFNGCRYVGEYKGKTPNGKGTLYYNDEEYVSYKGDFLNGMRHGYGTLIWKDGQKYSGAWENDIINGYGRMYFAFEKNHEFINSFIDVLTMYKYIDMIKGVDRVHRIDSIFWYSGDFKNGKMCGKGTLYYPKGFIFSRVVGEWYEGKRNGECIIYYSNGPNNLTGGTEFIRGTYKNGDLHGHGIVSFLNGNLNTVSGTWTNNKMHGLFYISHSDGSHDEGYMYDGEKDGKWRYYDRKGKLTSVKKWKKGKFIIGWNK